MSIRYDSRPFILADLYIFCRVFVLPDDASGSTRPYKGGRIDMNGRSTKDGAPCANHRSKNASPLWSKRWPN